MMHGMMYQIIDPNGHSNHPSQGWNMLSKMKIQKKWCVMYQTKVPLALSPHIYD